jgi:ATP-binding protein involved in chromosome partitioning
MNKTALLTDKDVRDILQTLQDPYLGQNLISANTVRKIKIEGQLLHIAFRLGFPIQGYKDLFLKWVHQALTDALHAEYPQLVIELEVATTILSHAAQKGLKGIKGVKNIIAVASGKGGVGKSTTSVNLALALQLEGARVGILDADIYGPSQPRMLGLAQGERPAVTEDKRMVPPIAYGLQTMSMGYLVEEEAPMVWRGPMVSSAVSQLTFESEWRDLDYLIVDLPPGTGDIQLTMAQKIPVSGAVIVTTPQDIALQDAKKALNMFNKLGIPVLGLIENMSIHICSQCGHPDPIFGSDGGVDMAKQSEIPFLGKLPLDRSIREQSDKGCPSVIADPEGAIAQLYRDIGRRTAAILSLQPRDYQIGIPKVSL